MIRVGVLNRAGSLLGAPPLSSTCADPPLPSSPHRRGHQRRTHPRHRHLWQLIKVGRNEGVVGPRLRGPEEGGRVPTSARMWGSLRGSQAAAAC